MSLDKLFLACKKRTRAARYNIPVDSSGQVLDAMEVPNSTFPMARLVSVGAFDVVTNPLLYPSDMLTWHNDTRAREWMSFFVAKIAQSDSLLDPAIALPDGAELAGRVINVVRRLFALVLAGNSDSFLKLPKPLTVSVQQLSTVNQVFLDRVMYKIALLTLCIDLAVIVNIYSRMPKPFLPRMPTSIASNIAFFTASYFAEELAGEADARSRPGEVVRGIKNSDRRFGFGQFLGTDGGVHIGIEREPFLPTLDLSRGLRRRPKFHEGNGQ